MTKQKSQRHTAYTPEKLDALLPWNVKQDLAREALKLRLARARARQAEADIEAGHLIDDEAFFDEIQNGPEGAQTGAARGRNRRLENTAIRHIVESHRARNPRCSTLGCSTLSCAARAPEKAI